MAVEGGLGVVGSEATGMGRYGGAVPSPSMSREFWNLLKKKSTKFH